MNRSAGSDPCAGKRYLSLETYRKTGRGVRTPVWFAAEPAESGPPKLYVYSTADSGKAKRIRRTGVVKIAPCDARGRVTGPWTAAHATIVGGEEFERGMRLLNRKYWPWKRILDMFVRHARVVIAIRQA
jgi:PPOX class probable F420-dependent enzyme